MKLLHVLDEDSYFAEITALARSARRGDRLAAATMSFAPAEPAISNLLHELTVAASRGAAVYLAVDAHAFMFDYADHAVGPLARGTDPTASNLPEFQQKLNGLQALAAAGGHYAIINQPGKSWHLPVAGRSHIKTFVLNDRLYIGGCNLSHGKQIDFMVGVQDAMGAARLQQLVQDSIGMGSMRQVLGDKDISLALDDTTTMLVDAGKPGQSVILQSALQLIDEAQKHVLLTCQFFPNSVTATHLARAHRRGVQLEVYYNHANKHTTINQLAQNIILLGERLRLPKAIFAHALPADHQRIHAKVLTTEKAAMIGSHNYVSAGVRLGTAEVALHSTDPTFVAQLTTRVQAALQPASSLKQ